MELFTHINRKYSMARLARVVAPHIPHHIIQRGNRRQTTFFCAHDYKTYMNLLSEFSKCFAVEIWAYCLMPNHVHLIAVPFSEDALRGAIGETHRCYTRHVNFREGWRGHLWQGRFSSYPMDEKYLLAAARYIELNPVKAKLVERPEEYPWSSATAHINKADDQLVRAAPLLDRVADWRTFLMEDPSQGDIERFRAHERTGRPLGDGQLISKLEVMLGRNLRRKKPGPKLKAS